MERSRQQQPRRLQYGISRRWRPWRRRPWRRGPQVNDGTERTFIRSANMTSTSANVNLRRVVQILSTLLGVLLCASVLSVAEQPPAKKAPAAAAAPSASI